MILVKKLKVFDLLCNRSGKKIVKKPFSTYSIEKNSFSTLETSVIKNQQNAPFFERVRQWSGLKI